MPVFPIISYTTHDFPICFSRGFGRKTPGLRVVTPVHAVDSSAIMITPGQNSCFNDGNGPNGSSNGGTLVMWGLTIINHPPVITIVNHSPPIYRCYLQKAALPHEPIHFPKEKPGRIENVVG